MKSRTLNCFIAMTLFAALAIPVRLAAQAHNQHQPRYTITDLGTLGGTFSQAFGINNKGSVVGYSTLTDNPNFRPLHAFLWREGVMTDLSTLGPTDTLALSAAYSINDNDEAVGLSETSTPDPANTCGFDSLVCLPILWRNVEITALPTLGGLIGEASAINNRGQVVGIAQTDETDPMCHNPVLKPTVWEGGQARALPTAPFRDGIVGGAPGPAGNNNKGEVVGIITACDFSASRAVLWEKHKVIDMGTLAGLGIAPISINNKEQATGTYTTIAGINRAFLWQDGVATDLGTLPGDNFAEGGPINDKGQIVGQSCSATSCSVFLWENNVMTDLNTLVPADSSLFMLTATGINSRGQIVGGAIQKTTSQVHAFLAIPCDEEHADSEGCEDRAEGATVVRGETNQRPNVVLPEIVRRLLQQRLRFGQFGVGR
jgi:probable HAF family extracellular repeat protein